LTTLGQISKTYKKGFNMRSISNLGVLLIVLATASVGCTSTRGLRQGSKMLDKTLAAQGYHLYRPFRSTDLPGTMFVLTKDHSGRRVEFTLAPWQDTFAAEPEEVFPQAGQNVGSETKITSEQTLSGDLKMSFVEPYIKGALGYENVKNVKLNFGDDQKKHVLDFARLQNLRGKLKDNTRTAVEYFNSRGQLSSCYLIVETLQVGTMDVDVNLTSGFTAEAAADKLKQVAEASVKISTKNKDTLTMQITRPTLIGFKAIKLSDWFVSTATTPPPAEYIFLTPADVERDW
jgi:hypothetical protein